MRVLPVTILVGTVAMFVASNRLPKLLIAAALILKIGESGLRYSLDPATRELLFLPVPSKLRMRAKAFIDVFIQRGAKGLAALLLLPVTFGLGASTAVDKLTITWPNGELQEIRVDAVDREIHLEQGQSAETPQEGP